MSVTSSLKLYSLEFTNTRTYLAAFTFILGNVAFPQLCHMIYLGGSIWLPIYFFTLIGSYKYGWRVGFITAVLSPVVNSILFGMPALGVLPIILLKSTLLAMAASFAARYFKKISIIILIVVVLFYQIVGSLGEWALTQNWQLAIQDFRIGIPGMSTQIFGGYLFIKFLIQK